MSCVLYNISKIGHIGIYWYYTRNLQFRTETRMEDENLSKQVSEKWWLFIILISSTGLLNSLLIIFSLNTELSSKNKQLKGSGTGTSFMNKFRQISEFRVCI